MKILIKSDKYNGGGNLDQLHGLLRSFVIALWDFDGEMDRFHIGDFHCWLYGHVWRVPFRWTDKNKKAIPSQWLYVKR